MKKIRLMVMSLISLLLPTALFAGSAVTKPVDHTWNSFYISLGLGSELLDGDQTTQGIWNGFLFGIPPTAYVASNRNSSSLSGNSLLGHLGLGFATSKGAFYLGVEPFLEVSDLGSNSNSTQIFYNGADSLPAINSTTQLRLSTLSGGLDLKPGLTITPQLTVFAVLGGDIRKVKLTSNAADVDLTGSTFGPNQSISSTTSSTKFAARFGFGMQSWVTPHWAVHMNFVHTFYPNFSTKAQESSAFQDGLVVTSISTSSAVSDINSNTLLFGANYYFDPANAKNALLSAPTNVRWQGFFAGLAMGMLINQYLDNLTTTFNTTSLVRVGSELDSNNLDGQTSLFVGFGKLIRDRFYVAIRGFANWANRAPMFTSAASTNTFPAGGITINNDQTVQVQMRDIEWGGDFLPGYLITPQTLLHLTVGFAGNKATLNSIVHTRVSLPVVLEGQVNTSTSKSLYGLRLGLGLQQAITNRVRMTADYVYTNYGKISLSEDGNLASIGTVNNTASFRMHSQAIMLGILIQM